MFVCDRISILRAVRVALFFGLCAALSGCSYLTLTSTYLLYNHAGYTDASARIVDNRLHIDLSDHGRNDQLIEHLDMIVIYSAPVGCAFGPEYDVFWSLRAMPGYSADRGFPLVYGEVPPGFTVREPLKPLQPGSYCLQARSKPVKLRTCFVLTETAGQWSIDAP